jgi:hypothetical protein
MDQIDENTKGISLLLDQYNADPGYGLILVLTPWSAPRYTRVSIPSRLQLCGGRDRHWPEGEPLEGKPLILTIVENYRVCRFDPIDRRK